MDEPKTTQFDVRVAPPTLILNRTDIAALMTPDDYLAAVSDAFLALATGRALSPPPLHITADGGGFHAKGARLVLTHGRAYAAVKVNANFPGNPDRHGLPTIQGAIVLSDAVTGTVIALMDSIEVTLRRTAAATALAARYLARPDADVVTMIGCGGQAPAQLEAIAQTRHLRKVFAYDLDAAARQRFVTTMAAKIGVEVIVAENRSDATRASGIVVCCTTAQMPFLGVDDIAPGTFIAAVGADAPNKSEIQPELMAHSKLVVDSLDQCAIMGDLHHALAAGCMTRDRVHAGLAELVAGHRSGRTEGDEITIFDSTGLAIQDVAAAVRIAERARAGNVGISLALGG